MKKIAILGSTGSIGQSTLSICEQFPERYAPVALAAGANVDIAFQQAQQWRPRLVSMATEELAAELQERLRAAEVSGVETVWGTAGTVAVATPAEGDFRGSGLGGGGGL